MKRNQRVITPSQVLAETVGEEETNVELKQETNETKKRKKRKWKENVYPLIYGQIYIKN